MVDGVGVGSVDDDEVVVDVVLVVDRDSVLFPITLIDRYRITNHSIWSMVIVLSMNECCLSVAWPRNKKNKAIEFSISSE